MGRNNPNPEGVGETKSSGGAEDLWTDTLVPEQKMGVPPNWRGDGGSGV